MKRMRLRSLALALAAILLLSLPAVHAKYLESFGFGLGTTNKTSRQGNAVPLNNAAATGNANTNSQQGFSIAYSANHSYQFKGSSYSDGGSGNYQRLTNLRKGYYAFVIRGGDGGVGKTTGGHISAYGGSGGYVMGYFEVDLVNIKELWIRVGHAGKGFTDSNAVGGAYGGGTGYWLSGSGGGYTVISTSQYFGGNEKNVIAIAGGGGGGGALENGGLSSDAINSVRDNTDANSRGGHAGGAGALGDPKGNAILNGNPFAKSNPGFVSGNAYHNGSYAVTLDGVRFPFKVYNTYKDNGVAGVVSEGFQGGNPNNKAKSTGTGGTNNSNGGGGGGGATKGGDRGYSTSNCTDGRAFTGGNGASGDGFGGAGGGAGWFGGGGGERLGNYKGGGGGGSSFVRHDVFPLTQGMINSIYLNPFISLPNNDYSVYDTSKVRPNRYRISTASDGVNSVGNDASGKIPLNNKSLESAFWNNGYNGFAYIKYLGPLAPEDSSVTRTGWPFAETQTPIPALNFSVFSDIHMNDGYTAYKQPNLEAGLRDVGGMKNDVFVLLGDNTDAYAGEYNQLYGVLNSGNDKIPKPNHIVAVGNHDIDGGGVSSWSAAVERHLHHYKSYTNLSIDKVYYTRDINGYRFIVLGAEQRNSAGGDGKGYISKNQISWLKTQMDGAPAGKPIFVLCHWPFNHLKYEGTETVQDVIGNAKYKNVFYFQGHTHGSYSVSNNGRIKVVQLPEFQANLGYANGGIGVHVEVRPHYNDVIIRQRQFHHKTWVGNTYTVPLT